MESIAGIIRNFFLSHLEVFAPQRREAMRWKDDGSMAGSADDDMDKALNVFLREHFSVPVISEEQEYSWPPSHKRFWLIDPRDGSNNAARGLYPLVGSMASLFEDGEPVFSSIFVPAEERDCGNGFYFAIRNGGAWRWETDHPVQIHVSKTDRVEKAGLLIEGPSRKVAADDRVRKLQQAMAWRINLTCAWTFTRLASGFADVVVSAHNKPTDALHGILFAREAGGIVTDFNGSPPTLENCTNLLYSNGILHDEALNILTLKERM
ncbi:MAG: inositol monophosphatase family protein [Patescibacteria group bacterium]